MKNKYLTIISVLLFIFSAALFAQNQSMTIVDFEAIGIAPEEAKVFSEHLQVELFNRDQFSILEKPELNKENKVCSSIPCLIEAGKIAKADLVIGGKISKVGESYSVTARLVDVKNQNVKKMLVYDHEGDIVSLLSTGVEQVANKLLEPKIAEATIAAPADSGSISLEKDSSQMKEKMVANPGGIGPCLASCLIGPRVGLEMNEGNTEIHLSEWIALGGSLVGGSGGTANPLGNLVITASRAYMAYEMGGKGNGLEGALAAYCIGPRVGNEIHYRKIRKKEWLLLIPCIDIYPIISIPLEAYHGKTMTEIEIEEGLRK